MDKKTFLDGLKKYLVDTLLATGLITLLFKDCSAYDIITTEINPKSEKIDTCLMGISRTISEMKTGVSDVSTNMTEIKDKYVSTGEEGTSVRIGYSSLAKDNEVLINSDNEYHLTTKHRITLINVSASDRPTFTFNVGINDERKDTSVDFFVNKEALQKLGITKLAQGVWTMSFKIENPN